MNLPSTVRLPQLASRTVYPSTSLLHILCLFSGHASRLISSPFPIPVRDHVQCLCSDTCHFGHFFKHSRYLLNYLLIYCDDCYFVIVSATVSTQTGAKSSRDLVTSSITSSSGDVTSAVDRSTAFPVTLTGLVSGQSDDVMSVTSQPITSSGRCCHHHHVFSTVFCL